VVASRTYLGPWLEKVEGSVQRYVVQLSRRHAWAVEMFRGHLVRQLRYQLQFLNLAEYRAGAAREKDEDETESDEDG
jgi:hypothetical protein